MKWDVQLGYMQNKHIILLGGYGNFGKRIAENLLGLEGSTVFVTGRDLKRAQSLAASLDASTHTSVKAARLDVAGNSFRADLQQLSPYLVIHTAGPFQGQDHKVPMICAELGSHYIDLADDRRFVCDIAKLDTLAKSKGISILSGVSSVPGLSSVVIDHHLPYFKQLQHIDFAIAPGNKAERGEATVRGILSYVGHPIEVYKNGKWQKTTGWGDSRKREFGGIVGTRWLANVDIPDLELFPNRYTGVQTVEFQAGLELPILHHGMSVMAALVQAGLVRNWAPLSRSIVRASNWFLSFGTDQGGMQITLSGLDHQNNKKTISWTLFADHGVGPYIPTIPAIILARKIINGEVSMNGASPCLGLFSLSEFDAVARNWGINHCLHEQSG